MFDGVKFSNNQKQFIKNISYVPQEIFLIEDTLKKNIALGVEENNIIDSKIEKVAKTSQINSFINNLKYKFETKVKENGKNFSVGQKQRIGVARALYRDPDLIILDESTSSLDTNTEAKFIEDIFDIFSDKTIIFISHKVSALKNCNKIFDLKEKIIFKAMSFIFKNFLSLLNIIYLNILILIKKNFFKKKIVIFYYPKEKLVINNISFIYNYFLKESNYFVFYGSTIRIKKKNFFLIKQTYLKFLFNIDLFLSNNVCDKFSVNSKKIYIHHDIYDTPLVEKKKEKALRKSLLKYDSIVVAVRKKFRNI